jgi:hypothetical protein
VCIRLVLIGITHVAEQLFALIQKAYNRRPLGRHQEIDL